jgi:hypothetical protein
VSAEAILVEATGLRAVFQRIDDRWVHLIELTDDTLVEGVVVMRSIEGKDDEPWPPSPPIQQLHTQQDSDGTIAVMGIGMSGRSHWSFSCRTELIGSFGKGEARYLKLDVACRVQQEFERVGSCYHVLPEVNPLEKSPRVYYQIAMGEWCVTASGVDRICDANQTLRMDCFGDHNSPFPQTVQWSYRIARSGKTMFELSTK